MREGNGERVSAHRILGARGLGEVEDGLGEGGQKADHQGFREQRPDIWSWGVGVGPKRETRGAIGDPRIRDGGDLGNQGKGRAE